MVINTGDTKVSLHFLFVQPDEFLDRHYAKDIKRKDIAIRQHVIADKCDLLQVS